MNTQSKSFLRISVAVITAVFLFLTLFTALNSTVLAAPTANDIRISQVYGGGGNSGAVYTNDFIELFNSGSTPIDLTGWSVQYASVSGSSWQVTVLAGSLNPGHYYLIQQAAGSGGTTPLPTPDATGSIAMSGSNGKVALVNNNTPLTGSCPTGVIDFVGFGSATNCYEGTATPNLSNTTAAIRNEGGCMDTDNNNADFTISAPTPRNTSSPTHSCITGPLLAMTKSVEPATAVAHNSTVTYTVILSNDGIVDETAVFFTDTLPVSTTFGAWLEQPSGATQAANEITWIGTVTNGEAITFTFTADQTGDYGDTIINTAEFSGTTSGTAQAGFTVMSEFGDITFVYHDLEDVVQPGEAVYIAGGFNGWNTTATPLTPDASFETFTATITAVPSTSYIYKYLVYTDTVPTGPVQYDWLNTNNRSLTVSGDAIINDYRNVVVGYAVLTGPTAMTTMQTFATAPISGAVFINSVTNPAGMGRGVMAQNGFGSQNDPGLWTWFNAGFIGQTGNNDVFEGVITPTLSGVFSYTNRFNGNWGMGNPNSVWAYGDLDGVHGGDPFELENTGVLTVTAAGVCDLNPGQRIHDIQGSGSVSPIVGANVTVKAVVTSNFQGGTGTLKGFHIQEEAADQDGNPATSEGIFVFNNVASVDVGDLVHVAATVSEFNGLTQLASATVTVCGSNNTITPTLVTLPLASGATWEPFEGMLIELQDLTATDNFRLGRFGQVRLATHRLAQPTSVVLPGAPANALQALNNLSYITLDDASTIQNTDPMVYPDPELTYTNTLRGGDVVSQVIGVIDQYTGDSSDPYRIQPTQPVDFTAVNVRENHPEVGGTIQVASFNVLNYFTTLGTSAICGPSGNLGCRGANNAFEFERQYTKIVNAIVAIDADVIGLMEIENNANDNAVIDLVTRLNLVAGAGVYDYIDTGAYGTDAIKQALIYKPAFVTPVGTYKILDSSVDANFDDTRNRPVIIQTFEEDSSGERFTVAVNHLKSKGSSCSGDPDLLDGQGNCNVTRTNAANALVDYLAGDPTGSGSDHFLIIGDMNSYAMEDPIRAIEDANYTNLINLFGGQYAYGYQFDGQWGYLDHGLASNALVPFVTAAAPWHLNADEPIVFDYNTEFKSANQIAIFFSPEPFRSSDHDPVLVGLDFTVIATPTIEILSPMAGDVFTSTDGTAVSVPVTITTTNFTIPADGHWHVWVDGVDMASVMDYDTSVNLMPGTYVISAELRSLADVSLGIMDSVSVTVVDASPEPAITILSPMAGDVFTSTNGTAVSVPVTITTTNFTIPADGHWHVWVDGEDQGPVMGYTTSVSLMPGAHVITAELTTSANMPLGVMDSVAVQVNVQYWVFLPVIMKP